MEQTVGATPAIAVVDVFDRPPGLKDVVVELREDSIIEGLTTLRSAVRRHLIAGPCHVTVDIAGVSRLSSAMVAALLWTQRHCRARGGHVTVRGPSQDSLNMLRRAGLGEVFDIQLGGLVDGGAS
ncbi:MAG TPA: STAS domain-containing protein [Actinomycetales bacterium]|jgi:ABC-type transporter Mla MlaB component|nr:STAS domain-containing protein [Actinomycetales bacterium]